MMRPPFTSPDSESHLLSCECPTRNFRASCSLSYAQHVTAGITTTQAAPAARIRSRNPNHHDDQISMEKALRMVDDEYQMQFHHQLRQLGSLQRVTTETRGDKETMQDFAVILARLEKHHRPIMDAQRMDEDEERQALLWLREWLGLAEDPDELPLHKKAGLGGGVGDGGGGDSRGDSHRKRRQNNEKEKGEAQTEPRVKPREKAKAMGLGKDRSDVWVERVRGELCCIKKTREKKER